MHVEEHGNPAGRPALVLHGGPGSGSSPLLHSLLDPAHYRILCPDQRGAGRSTPAGEIASNTLEHLLADLRLLREPLRVDRWLVVGGSWGATLALVHAIDQPGAVAGLLLRNVFLARPEDITSFFDAAVRTNAEAWRGLQQQAEVAGRPLVDHLAEVFASGTWEAQCAAALCWSISEQQLAGARAAQPPDAATYQRLVQRYRVQSHYLRHGCWLTDPPLLERCARLPAAPTLLLHGTQDAICPPEGAAALHQVLGGRATLRWVPGAGHDPTHPAMAAAMKQALHEFAETGMFQRV
ncbi:alpha/beta fold hydrolase [Ramlibacter henchirensis]|uniref:Proline iminopeptidase n=2 Tax=Ramlibacter henchirensis TaxID=204072 RepID=A0A4Z0C6Y7_9BURK|nr:alpha/beta fold hydrolase [Ramlibacter henchirensis]